MDMKIKSKKKIVKKTNPKHSKQTNINHWAWENEKPTSSIIKKWMLEYIVEHPSFIGTGSDINLLADRAIKHFKLNLNKRPQMIELGYKADKEYYDLTKRFT